MARRTILMLILTLALTACREPMLEQDGTAATADATDSGTGPADIAEAEDMIPLDGPLDNTLPPLDVTLIDESSPDQVPPVDVVGPQDTAPLELTPEEVVADVVPIDIVPPGPTCGDIFMCGIAKGCGLTSDFCWSTCFGEAGEAELQAFTELTDCVGALCEQLPPEEQGDCLMSECIDEVLDCVGGDGEAGCMDTFLCIQGCGQDDGLCFFECIQESSEESLTLLLDMSNATESENLALIIECAGGEGDLNCGETVTCFTSCEDNPPPPDDPPDDPEDGPGDEPGEDPAMDCMMTCISQSSPEGAEDLLAFLDCSEEACPDGMDECPGIFACMSECPGIMF